jgi:hypothetical protein
VTERHPESERLARFKNLDGPSKVATFFRETFGFFKESDPLIPFERNVLITSPDPSINDALIAQAKQPDSTKARYAIFLLSMRLRFVPQKELPLKHAAPDYLGGDDVPGILMPFAPNLDRFGSSVAEMLRSAMQSPDRRMQEFAKLYSGATEQELSALATKELVALWHKEISELSRPPYARYDAFSERAYRLQVLKRLVVAHGLDSATAVGRLLESESKPVAREQEIDMLRSIDAGSVRLRGSEEGRRLITIVERVLRTKPLWGYRSEIDRLTLWREIERQVLKDEFMCNYKSWGNMLALAFEQLHGDGSLIPAHTSSQMCNSKRVSDLIGKLTALDPAFPSWEFASTGTEDDMLHPQFRRKIARYHEASRSGEKSAQ